VGTVTYQCIESHQNAEFTERPPCASRQVGTSRIGAVDNIHVMIARYERRVGTQVWKASKKIDELGPLRACSGIRNVAREQDVV
jgi:hypothetical protein